MRTYGRRRDWVRRVGMLLEPCGGLGDEAEGGDVGGWEVSAKLERGMSCSSRDFTRRDWSVLGE
eukprot:8500280-Prorocentrum_lima.AAC.1